MNANTLLAFLLFIHFGTAVHGLVLPTIRVGLPSSMSSDVVLLTYEQSCLLGDSRSC